LRRFLYEKYLRRMIGDFCKRGVNLP